MDLLQELGLACLCFPKLEELGVMLSCIAMAKHRLKNSILDMFVYIWLLELQCNKDGETKRARSKKCIR